MGYFELIKRLFSVGEQLKQKAWWLSRMVWVNLLALVAQAIALATHNRVVVENPEVVAIASGVLAVVNIFLRWRTTSPIGNETIREG